MSNTRNTHEDIQLFDGFTHAEWLDRRKARLSRNKQRRAKHLYPHTEPVPVTTPRVEEKLREEESPPVLAPPVQKKSAWEKLFNFYRFIKQIFISFCIQIYAFIFDRSKTPVKSSVERENIPVAEHTNAPPFTNEELRGFYRNAAISPTLIDEASFESKPTHHHYEGDLFRNKNHSTSTSAALNEEKEFALREDRECSIILARK